MRFKRLVAIAGLSLFGVFGSVYAATGSPPGTRPPSV
jgi:hypothetical protein